MTTESLIDRYRAWESSLAKGVPDSYTEEQIAEWHWMHHHKAAEMLEKIIRQHTADHSEGILDMVKAAQGDVLVKAIQVCRDLASPYTGNPEDKSLDEIIEDAKAALSDIEGKIGAAMVEAEYAKDQQREISVIGQFRRWANKPVASEMIDNTPENIWIKEFELSALSAEDYSPRYKVVGINRIRELLHHLFNEEAMKPVSVSLRDVCKNSRLHDVLGSIDPTTKEVVRAVLSAAGVSYVD